MLLYYTANRTPTSNKQGKHYVKDWLDVQIEVSKLEAEHVWYIRVKLSILDGAFWAQPSGTQYGTLCWC